MLQEQEEEEGEQQDKGHQDPDQDVQVPFETLDTSDVMDEPMVPFNRVPVVCQTHNGPVTMSSTLMTVMPQGIADLTHPLTDEEAEAWES